MLEWETLWALFFFEVNTCQFLNTVQKMSKCPFNPLDIGQ